MLHFCFELNSFSRHSSSSGERLYDIRRISSSKVFGLSKKQVSISAIHTTLPLYLQNMKENYFMTKLKPKVLKLQSNDSQDNSMQGVNLAFANSCELFIRDILPAVFFLLETSKLRIWFNFVIGSRKTHNLTCSYFLFHLVRSESARSTRSSYDFHILTALAAATKCCEWYFSSALKSIPKHPKGLSFQDFNRCCPLCLNKRVGPTLLIRSGYVEVQYLILFFLLYKSQIRLLFFLYFRTCVEI